MWAAFDNSGRIFSIIRADSEEAALAMAGDLQIVECAADVGVDTHRIVDGEAVAFTSEEVAAFAARPSLEHHWNAATRQWFDPRSLEQLRAAKWAEIKEQRGVAAAAGFSFGGKVYQSDPVSLQNITGATVAAMLAVSAGQPFSVDWTTADNSVVTLTAEQAIALGAAAVAHVSAQYDHGVALRTAINAAANAGELDAIEW